MEIKKKCWPELFEKILSKKKNADLRLADFEIKEGDVLVLEEYNPKAKKYTGRFIRKRIKNLNKIKTAEFNSVEEIIKHGHYLIEFE
ncbi:MAG: DUF3850 domain-containing protein [archaeon]